MRKLRITENDADSAGRSSSGAGVNGARSGRRGWTRLAGFLLFAVATGLVACSSKDGVRLDNQRPWVRLTGGPIQGDSASYSSEFFWTGWDQDGVIDRYQYAIDIPDNFSLEDINNPRDVGIAWKDTTAFRARFLFEAPIQDSTYGSDGVLVLPNRSRGDHTIYVRSVDNEGAVSAADFLSFTARTVTPKTTITVPKVVSGGQPFLTVGKQLSVGWTGEDPDNPDPKRQPKYYEWKLIPVRGVLGIFDANEIVNIDPGPNFAWNRIGADTTRVRVNLDPPKSYVFAVRAIDEAGGVERKFFFAQNAILMQSSNGPFVGRPVLTVRERTLGQNVFPADGDEVSYEVAQGKCLRFSFSADASAYGGVVDTYNWGIDVPDVRGEGPGSGFRGATNITYTYEPICFNTPGIHTVTIKCRDTGGEETIGTYKLTVLGFPLDRDILYLDDVYLTLEISAPTVTDAFIDNRLKTALRGAGFDQVFEYNAWGAGDENNGVLDPRLSDLARYKHIFWAVRGYGGGTSPNQSALLRATSCRTGRILQSYVGAGGSVWISGESTFGSLKAGGLEGGQCVGALNYSVESGVSFEAGDFVFDFLHIDGGDLRQARTVSANNGHGLLRALPTSLAAAERFPVIEADSNAFNYRSLAGLSNFDAMFQPTFYREGGLDTLYTAQTVKQQAPFRGKPIAFRYADPNPVPEQGPVAIWGIPLYRVKDGVPWAGPNPQDAPGRHLQGAVSAMEDWFRRHQFRAAKYLAPR